MASVKRTVSQFMDSRGHIRRVVRTTTFAPQRGFSFNGENVDPTTDPRVAAHPDDLLHGQTVISKGVANTTFVNPQSVAAFYQGKEVRG